MMSDLDHRVGVREANLVVRHLKLEGVSDENKQALLDDIDHTFGIDSVSYDDKSATLNVAYDAVNCCIDGIEEKIKAHGADISHDWWTRFKESYYQFTDQNIKDNAQHEPWSCHKSPPGSSKK
jgi:hypothetical protein